MEYLIVDVDKRQIMIPESIGHLGVKDDNETRTLRFKMPSVYKGLDMSGYAIEINFINAEGKADSALANNVQVNGEEITFNWDAGGTAYAKDGMVRFLVYTYLENEDAIKTNEWHTTWAKLPVLDGGNVEDQIAEENPRIIEEMLRRIRDLENGETGGTKDAVQYIEQELTDEQKTQARTNIGAISEEEVNYKLNDYAPKATTLTGYGITDGATKEDILQVREQIADYTTHKADTNIHVTSAEKQKWNQNVTGLETLSQEVADLIEQNELTQYLVDSVDEMTDTTKKYVLKSTGTIWEYKETTTEKEVTVTDNIEGTDDNPYYDNSRLSSSATEHTFSAQNGYHVTPKIDLTKEEYVGKVIQLHLEGAIYITESDVNYIMNRAWNPSGAQLWARGMSNLANSAGMGSWHNVEVSIESSTSATLTITIPLSYATIYTEIGYLAFCGQGAVADSNIYITYRDTQTVKESAWVDTNVQFGAVLGGGIDEETLAKISALNNEGSDPTTIKLLSQPVLDFYNASAYSDDDYTTSHLSKITYPCRADIPIPFVIKWNYNEDAMRTIVAVDKKTIGTVNNYTLLTYDATGLNKYPIYNLIPNTRYYYKVTHVLSGGSLVEAKSGTFVTSSETVRLIYIDGTQNVRDLGGWTGLDGKTVKYGNIFRGASLSDSSFPELIVTGKGRRSLGELDVQAELNLGASDTETSIASNCVYTKIGYANYATAITNETYRGYFKTALEWIIDCLTNSKPIYMHCQGGCDRTGTLSFQLLGLLGVSESDLAKEYELSSFSSIGFGRLRTTTLAVNTYDYVGMVEAIKTYSGDTITDKFYNFALDCGISADTITSFRNLMLE